MTAKQILIGVLAGTALAGGLFFGLRMSAPADPQVAFVLPEAETLTEFSLVDQNGNEFTPASFRGQWDLVFFGFTSCPDICPATLQKLAAAKKKMRDSGITELPRIVLVSVDPEHDTPELMGQYVDYFGDDNVGITGELEQVQKLAKSLYVYFGKVELDGGGYTVDHSPAVLLINPDGRYHAGFGGIVSIDEYASDLPILMGTS